MNWTLIAVLVGIAAQLILAVYGYGKYSEKIDNLTQANVSLLSALDRHKQTVFSRLDLMDGKLQEHSVSIGKIEAWHEGFTIGRTEGFNAGRASGTHRITA